MLEVSTSLFLGLSVRQLVGGLVGRSIQNFLKHKKVHEFEGGIMGVRKGSYQNISSQLNTFSILWSDEFLSMCMYYPQSPSTTWLVKLMLYDMIASSIKQAQNRILLLLIINCTYVHIKIVFPLSLFDQYRINWRYCWNDPPRQPPLTFRLPHPQLI